MKYVNKNSRLSALFTIDWQDRGGIFHQDNFWTSQMNLWRDCLPAELVRAIQGKTEGERVFILTDSRAFYQPYDKRNIIEVKGKNIRHPVTGEVVIPVPGRYYPQSFLQGVDGVFRVSRAPSLCLAEDNGMYVFDRNHPLAGYELNLAFTIEQVHGDRVERGGRCEDWLERICIDGPGMQAKRDVKGVNYFEPANLERGDNSPDSLFYEKPRLVQHLDENARAVIRENYGRLTGKRKKVLDLMASWDSHLPGNLELERLTVLGLNDEELRANRVATDICIQDLNGTTKLPFDTAAFDAVICTASVEYLTDPLSVFKEIERVLVPGGVAVIAFSNRWFAPKAIRVWSEMNEFERLGMVLELFCQTPGFHNTASMTMRGKPRPDDDPHPEYLDSDPVFMAWSYKEL